MKKLTIIDGNSLLFRCYFATAYPGSTIMSTKDGIPTNAIFAFSNMINKIISSLSQGEGLFVCFDKDSHTFRREKMAAYKAQRKPAPEELVKQFPIAREFLDALGIKQYEVSGYEADDIAGTLATLADKEGIKVNIYTSDKDYIQLVSNNVTLSLIRKGLSDINVLTPDAVKEQFGFDPIQIIDYKGLLGDASDNLPGITGIGEKGAVKLIQEYHDFDNIIAHKDEITGKAGEAIRTYYEQGTLSRDMAIIYKEVPLPFTLNDTIYEGYEFNKANDFANKYELRQFINKLTPKFKKKDLFEEKINSKKVDSFSFLKEIKKLSIYLDYENDYHSPIIKNVYMSDEKEVFSMDFESFKNDKNSLELLVDPSIKFYGFDLKAVKVALATNGINFSNLYFDILIGTYLLDSSNNKNPEAVLAYYGINLNKEEKVDLFSLEEDTNDSNAKICLYSLLLEERISKDLEKVEATKLFYELEMPLVSALADMEIEGFPLHINDLDEIGNTFKEKLKDLEKRIYIEADEEFNISSPKQLAEILFDKLNLPNDGKSRSTANDVLTFLSDKHPIVPLLIEYRKYSKLNSTYIEGLKPHIKSDKKIHASFNQVDTTTGRLSSSNPNLQNISVRDEEGKLIRKCFYYDDNNIEILSLDYSQIELRLLAHLSNCKPLIDIFNSNEDIHSSTAKAVFKLDREPTSLERRKAKAVNFGIVYGISDWGLSEQINIPVKEAKEIINNFYLSFPEVGEFLKNVVDQALEKGYVSTMSERRRYLREINDPSYQVREFAKRAAMNAPIQGSAADLIKIAMVKVNNALKEGNFKTKMVCQIHDELLFKVYKDEKEKVYNLIKDIMEHALSLKVPLKVDGGFGKAWYDCK